jgi:tRNA(Ile)-lysidine synthase
MSGRHKQFYEHVLNIIRQYRMIDIGNTVVVGISGGVDSVVLLYVLYQLQNHLGIRLYSAHLNHQFRGQEAEHDAEFVRRFSEKLEIPCYIDSRNVPEFMKKNKLSPQDAARQVRYQFFESIAERVSAQKIATAHTADDQAETVLIGLIRGVGIHGLGGIQPILNQKIIRPLLTTTRDQIEAFAEAEELDYVFDSSNTSRKYLRNAVRLDLLPLLKQQFNPTIVKRLTAYAQLFREDAFFIDKIATERYYQICENVDGGKKIKLDLFTKEHITIQRALIYKIFEKVTGTRQGLETNHVRAVIDLFTQKESGKRLSLPGRVIAVRSYAWGYIQRKTQVINTRSYVSPVCVVVPGRTLFDDFCIDTEILEPTLPETYVYKGIHTTDLLIQSLDYDRISLPITVRYRLSGDCFRPLGMQGKKTLKKFFIDRKIPRDTRNNIPLFEDKNGIFWVAGYCIDDRVKITKNTQKVFLCRVYKQVKSNYQLSIVTC